MQATVAPAPTQLGVEGWREVSSRWRSAVPPLETLHTEASSIDRLQPTCAWLLRCQTGLVLLPVHSVGPSPHTLLWCVRLPNARPNLQADLVWEPPVHLLVFEARFTIAQSRVLGATNVYHMSLYVAHSQSYQLYQMT